MFLSKRFKMKESMVDFYFDVTPEVSCNIRLCEDEFHFLLTVYLQFVSHRKDIYNTMGLKTYQHKRNNGFIIITKQRE